MMSSVLLRRTGVAGLAMSAARAKHTLPDLPYDYNALEPTISADIMRIHHDKHHRAYVTNLNVAEEKLNEAIAKNDVSGVVAVQSAFKFNGGGHINHSIFWTNLSPTNKEGGKPPTGDFAKAFNAEFGSLESFIEKFNAASVGVQGSGWGWLGYDKNKKRLAIATCPNQDPLEATTGLVPLLGIDVWEHAYYLQYKNVRPDYLKAIWNVVNWSNVADRFKAASASK